MAKRGRYGDGSLSQRKDGRWDAQLWISTNDGPKRLRTTKKTRGAGQRWLTQKRFERDNGSLLRSDTHQPNLTVAKYLTAWLTDSVEGTVARHTYSDYKHKVEKHIIPEIGGIKLQALTTLHLQKLYRKKAAQIGIPTARYIHATISKALSDAERWDMVRKNVARYAKPPRLPHTEPDPLSLDEAKKFLAAIRGHEDEALYLLAVTTSLGRGELLGLKWSDVDFDTGHLKVLRSLDTYGGPHQEKDTKRKSRLRPAILLTPVAESLKRHRKTQAELKLASSSWEEHDYVFPTGRGTGRRGDNVLKRSLKPLAESCGIEVTFQKLRRSYATFHVLLGSHARVLQRAMGHGSFETTGRFYAGVPDELQYQAAKALEGLLFDEIDGSKDSDEENLDILEAELQQKLLQIQELKSRARQDSNLRPPDS